MMYYEIILFLALFALPGAASGAGFVDLPCGAVPEGPDALEAFAVVRTLDGFVVADLSAGRLETFSPEGGAEGARGVPDTLAACGEARGGVWVLFPGAAERYASAADLLAATPERRVALPGFAPARDPARFRLAVSPDGALYLHDRRAGLHRVFDAAGRPAGEFPSDGPVLPRSAETFLDAPCDEEAGLVVTELPVRSAPDGAGREPDTFRAGTGLRERHGAVPVAMAKDGASAWLLVPGNGTRGGEAEAGCLELLRVFRDRPPVAVTAFPFGAVEGFATVREGTLWLASPLFREGRFAAFRVHEQNIDAR